MGPTIHKFQGFYTAVLFHGVREGVCLNHHHREVDSHFMHVLKTPLKILVLISALAITACSSAAPAASPTASRPTEPIPTPSVTPSNSSSSGPKIAIGHEVGDRVLDFEIHFADSSLNSSQLLEEGRPTFLFFFATW